MWRPHPILKRFAWFAHSVQQGQGGSVREQYDRLNAVTIGNLLLQFDTFYLKLAYIRRYFGGSKGIN